jgi:hypothetical protein
MEGSHGRAHIFAGHSCIAGAGEKTKRCFSADALLLRRGNMTDHHSRRFGLLWASCKRSSNRLLVVGIERGTCRTLGSSVVPQARLRLYAVPLALLLLTVSPLGIIGCASPCGSRVNVSRTSLDWHLSYFPSSDPRSSHLSVRESYPKRTDRLVDCDSSTPLKARA